MAPAPTVKVPVPTGPEINVPPVEEEFAPIKSPLSPATLMPPLKVLCVDTVKIPPPTTFSGPAFWMTPRMSSVGDHGATFAPSTVIGATLIVCDAPPKSSVA